MNGSPFINMLGRGVAGQAERQRQDERLLSEAQHRYLASQGLPLPQVAQQRVDVAQQGIDTARQDMGPLADLPAPTMGPLQPGQIHYDLDVAGPQQRQIDMNQPIVDRLGPIAAIPQSTVGQAAYWDQMNQENALQLKTSASIGLERAKQEAKQKTDALISTKDNIKFTDDLRAEVDRYYKPHKQIESAFRKLDQMFRDDSGELSFDMENPAFDLATVFQFMKVIDPGSTVREGEFATAENAGGIPGSIRAMYNKMLGRGRLSPEIRKGFYEASRRFYQQEAETVQSEIDRYGRIIAIRNAERGTSINPDQVLPTIWMPSNTVKIPQSEMVAGGGGQYSSQLADIEQMLSDPNTTPDQRVRLMQLKARYEGIGQ